MTAPGSIIAPQPSWWVRTDRIGTNTSQYGWVGAASGPHAGQAVGIFGWASDAAGMRTPAVLADIVAEVETSTAVLNLNPARLHETVTQTPHITPVLNSRRVMSVTRSTAVSVTSGLQHIAHAAVNQTMTATVTAGLTKSSNVILKGTNVSVTTSVTIPAHNVGDIIVIYALNAGGTTAPTKPAASGTVPNWTVIDNAAGANACASGTFHFIATATNHTSGTWTGTTDMAAAVLSGESASTPIGGHAESGSTVAGSAVAPAVTMTNTDGTSVLLHFFGYNTSITWSAAPTGYTTQASNGLVCVDTKNSSTSDGAVTQANNAGSIHGYRGATVEIRSH